jgi:hypothetical protein
LQAAVLKIDERQQAPDHQVEQEQNAQEMSDAAVDGEGDPGGQQLREQHLDLLAEAAVLFADVVTTRFERAAQ